jgi:uncharacterized protein YcbX
MAPLRANIEVSGLPAYGEDALRFATGQNMRLDYAIVCERCIVVTTDQKSGERE